MHRAALLAAVIAAIATLPHAAAFTAPAALTRSFGGQAAALSPGVFTLPASRISNWGNNETWRSWAGWPQLKMLPFGEGCTGRGRGEGGGCSVAHKHAPQVVA